MPIMVLCAVFYAPVAVFTNRNNAQIGCWCLPADRQVFARCLTARNTNNGVKVSNDLFGCECCTTIKNIYFFNVYNPIYIRSSWLWEKIE